MKLALMVDAPNTIPGESYVKVPSGPYMETLGLAAELGFDGVEILIGRPETADIESLQAAVAQTGMQVAAINSGRLYFDYGLALISADAVIQTAGRTALLDLARHTAPLQAPINIGVFRGLPAARKQAEAFNLLVEILQETADEIAELDITLMLEPGNQKEFPFIYSTAVGIACVEQTNRPNVALMLDTFHMSMEDESLTDAFAAAIPMLKHIHFLDRQRNPPSDKSEGFDLISVLETLQRYHYQHYISMPLMQDDDLVKTADRISALKSTIEKISKHGE